MPSTIRKELHTVVKLGEVCQIIMGQSPPSETYNTNQKGLPFFQGKAEFTDLYPIVEKWCSEPKKIANPNDILLSVRAPVGATNIANVKCCIGRGLAALRYKNFKYLYYFLKSIEQELDSKGTGTTFRAISGETLRETIFPEPPPEMQDLIVSKIEELFSELDKGIENLKLAQEQLTVYRQSVLKWAFEGRLTNKIIKKGELPASWKISELGKVCQFSQGIQVDVNLQLNNQKSNSVRFLRIIDFTQRTEPPRYIADPGAKYHVNNDDISLVRYGASTGFVCTGQSGVIANNLFRVIPDNSLIKKYLYYFLNSIIFQNIISKNIKGAAMPAISFGLIKDIPIHMPDLEEQLNILNQIEHKISVIDKLEDSINEALDKAEVLKQSILKNAFEGSLI